MRWFYCFAVVALLALPVSCNSGSSSTPLSGSVDTPPDSSAAGAAPFEIAGAFPVPSELPRAVSWEIGENLTYGRIYVDPLPHNRVVPDADWICSTFQSTWDPGGGSTLNDLSFAMYLILVEDGTPAELHAVWEIAPEAGLCHYGLANFDLDRWDWFADEAQPINTGDFTPYVDEGVLLMVVCSMDTAPCRLAWLRCGPNLPPDTRLNADQTLIEAADSVHFDLEQSWDPELGIALFEFDFDGDGEYDTSSPDIYAIDHTYATPGTFTAVGRVTDGEGAGTTDELTIHVSAFQSELLEAVGRSPSLVDSYWAPAVSYGTGEDYSVLNIAYIYPEHFEKYELHRPPGVTNMHTAMTLLPVLENEVIAYGDSDLWIGYHDYIGSDWYMEPVDDRNAGSKPAIVVDGNDDVNIFHSRTEGEFPLQTAHFTRTFSTPTGWDHEQLDAGEPTGHYCDAVYEGYLTTVYAPDEGVIGGGVDFGFYSTIDGWSWQTACSDLNHFRSSMSLAINPADHMPHIAYIADPSAAGADRIATYTWYAEDDWLTEALEPHAWHSDLALDSAGWPHVIVAIRWSQPESYEFWYHWNDGAEWHRDFAALSGEGVVEHLDFILDGDDQPHFCWTFIPESETISRLMYSGMP